MFGNLFLKDEIARELLRGDDEDEDAGDRRRFDAGARPVRHDRDAAGAPSFLDDERDVDAEIVTGGAAPDR